MKTIKISESGIDTAIREASRTITEGGLVAFPTETFYGIGARYDDSQVLRRLYQLKNRPRDNAIPVIIGENEQLSWLTPLVNPLAAKLIERFWPGPLTLLFRALSDISVFISAGTGKVAVRIPGRSFALDLARAISLPVTATSANISGMPPSDNPGDVACVLGGGLDLLIDGGRTPGGKPSTIVDVTGEKMCIVREGAIPEEELRSALAG
jgi:L-threonylcarbamoyladenylate synthase